VSVSFERLRARMPALLAGPPPELAELERWLAAERGRRDAAERDYLFGEERLRFEPRREDVVVALAGLEVSERAGGALVRSAEAGLEASLDGVGRAEVERILGALDGTRTLLEARWEAGVSREALARTLRATFGRVLFAPHAVAALEAAVPGVECVRHPCPPYAIDRSYWQNAGDVRAWIGERLEDALTTARTLLEAVRELHVVLLMGASLESFYKPASPASDSRLWPGALELASPRLVERPGAVAVFLDGPRVDVSPAGGERYHRLLHASVGDAEALADRACREDGVDWGRVVLARGEHDAAPRPWFCPPRPVTHAHFEALHGALASAAASSASESLVPALARFHRLFVRLHPFSCGNQSLAMAIVNALAARALGAGIPHLLLDSMALRLEAGAYERLFARAVGAWCVPDADPARRLATLLARKRAAFALVRRMGAGASDDEARALVAADPAGARAALFAV
jgi:hypothetical protein